MGSIQDDEFWRMCVGSDINWEKPYSELIDSICVPSLFVMLWTHELIELALTSSSRIVKAQSLFLILHRRFSRDRRKCSDSLWFWPEERYKAITYPFFFPLPISHAKHSGRFILLICLFKNLIITIDAYTSSSGVTGVICSIILQSAMHFHPLKLRNQGGFLIYREYLIFELNQKLVIEKISNNCEQSNYLGSSDR